jgi:hypothetical protein
VVCPYSKKVENVLVFYNPPKTSIIYHHKRLFFCSFPNSLFYQNWNCSCPPHHHTWYPLGHSCLVQSITPNTTHYNTYRFITTSNTATNTKFASSLVQRERERERETEGGRGREREKRKKERKKKKKVSFANRPFIMRTASSGIAVHSTNL